MPDVEKGLAALKSRFARATLEIIEHKRPWPDRSATYVILGKSDRRTDIVFSDGFLSQLPGNTEYQAAADSYAAAIEGRIKCGSPEIFYCRSAVAVRIEIHWPISTSLVDSKLSSWLRVNATDNSDGKIAVCILPMSLSPFDPVIPFDTVRSTINRVRTAIDEKAVTLYERRSHPNNLQQLRRELSHAPTKPNTDEVERFIAGKAYWLGFRAADTPGEVWIADPWDSDYLGVTPRELAHAAQVLRARGLIELDATPGYARPSDTFLVKGWPAALGPIAVVETPKASLSSLPRKDKFLADVASALERRLELAVLVIDLDNFKSVNDVRGHQEGDACLERVVQAIAAALGRKGTLYRWGGDEFAVSLTDFSSEEGRATAERIRRAVEESKPGKEIPVTTSIGVSASDQMGKPTPKELLDAADRAMYASKRAGKNRVTLASIDQAQAQDC